MPPRSLLHTQTASRFREVFGPPNHTLDDDEHWSLEPPTPDTVNVHVLINGSVERPAIWIFDANVRVDGVIEFAVTLEQQIEDIIQHIHDRLKRAAPPKAAE